MTRRRYLNARCPKCKIDAVCPHCGEKIPSATPFSDWLRNLPYPLNSRIYSLHNMDYIWHNYRSNWFITMEEKRFKGKPSFSQKDTHGIVRQLLEKASGAVVTNERKRKVSVEYRGHYYISFEKTTPSDSRWVRINGEKYTDVEKTITYLLIHGIIEKQ